MYVKQCTNGFYSDNEIIRRILMRSFNYFTEDNVARGRRCLVKQYNHQRYSSINTWRLMDVNNIQTCDTFKGREVKFTVDLGKKFNIRSTVLTFKGKYIHI
jgi:hypothetical protein